MNLHKIASKAIGRVNPFVSVTIRQSDGYQTLPSGNRTPQYKPDITLMAQVQPLSSDDLKHVDNLNIQGIVKSVHVDGNFYGTVRKEQKGGDLIIIDGVTWLIIQPLELWPDWCRLLVVMQLDKP